MLLAMSVALGRVICVLDPQEAAERDARIIAGKGDPTVVLPAADPPVLGVALLDPAAGALTWHGTLAPRFVPRS